jgi:hypothetical protein
MKEQFVKWAIALICVCAFLFLGCPNSDDPPDTTVVILRWETVQMEFKAENKVSISSLEYDYTYDSAALTGEVSGDLNRRTGQTGIVNRLGPFTVDDNTLTFSDYRESGAAVVFTRTGAGANDSLEGTVWRFFRPDGTFSAAENLIGVIWYGPNFVIECLDASNAILYALDGYYTSTTRLTYTYDDAGQSGKMTFVSGPLNGNPGNFIIRSDYTFSTFEDFAWRGGNKTKLTAAYNMSFSTWKTYPHGWDFVKLDASGIEEGASSE